MQSVDKSNNNSDPSQQTDESTTDKGSARSVVCLTSKKHIISQALIAASKETSSANSIVDNAEKSNDDGDRPKGDVIDRIFGFAENLICSADNTTNVDIDPKILIAEERKSLFACGDEGKTDDKIHIKTFVNKIAGEEILVSSEDVPAGKDNANLQKKPSDDTGSTAADSVVGIGVTVKNKPKSWASLYCCMGRDIEDSVVFTESMQVSS